MDVSDLEHFRALLDEREHNLSEWKNSLVSENGDDVQKVQSLLDQIKNALGRVENHTYGICKECHDQVEAEWLEIQPAAEICLECITDKEKANLEEEIFLASKIHRALLPTDVGRIEGFEIAVRSLAARQVGGDYYDFLPAVNGGMTRVVIADTMGKGLPAGLIMSNVQGALRILAEDISSPKRLINRLNTWLCRNIPVTKFILLVCLGLESGTDSESRLIYSNAGHCPPILIRHNGAIENLEVTGGVLGVHEEFSYEEGEISFSSGDMLILFTDGVTEASNEKDDLFGDDRLKDFVAKHQHDTPKSLVANLVETVRTFSNDPDLDDDLTVIAIRKT